MRFMMGLLMKHNIIEKYVDVGDQVDTWSHIHDTKSQTYPSQAMPGEHEQVSS